MNQRIILFLFALFTSVNLSLGNRMINIEQSFKNIPDSQQLAVYWYWMSGNISKEGVVKDLQAMKKVGINRVQIGIIGSSQGTPEGPVKCLSEEWWDILHQALKTAGELNIEVGIFNCPGWSQSGGPWVKPNQAMRYLYMEKDTIVGGKDVSLKLNLKEKDAERVRVLAFPLLQSKAKFSVSGNAAKLKSILFKSEKPAIARSLTVYPQKSAPIEAELYVKTEKGNRSVHKFIIDRSNPKIIVGFNPYAPITISLPSVEGQEFELKLSKEGGIVKAELNDIPVVESYAEKTLAKMWQTPHPMWDAYLWRKQPDYDSSVCVNPSDVMDITSKVDKKGILHWKAPKGKWIILDSQMRPTGTQNAPAPTEVVGFETDKMSKKHIRAHFDNYIGKILERIPAHDRKTFKIVVEDSYETGGQNWTDDMIPDFKAKYGYDPIPYLPTFEGVVVGSEDISDRFLWDVRRLIADEVAYNYVGGLREVSNEHGLTTWLENYGHWGFPSEFLKYGGQSDEIAGEFWSFGTLGDIENKVASSCGHIYGKNKIWAESFTCGGTDFIQYPATMKQRGDKFFTEGINATLLHVYIQQPNDNVPGINAWFGNEFNRNNTWFSQLDIFSKYLKRCNYMLQQGRYVADVAYYIDENAPKMTGVRTPECPQGFSYDYLNAEVLLTAKVSHGELVLPGGMRYRVLVLPRLKTMRPEVLSKIKELVNDGLVLLGIAPECSPSLQNYPQVDEQVKQMAEELWQMESKPFAQKVKYGKGTVYRNASLEQIFADFAISPDFIPELQGLPLLYIHRTTDEGEVYFVSNQSDKQISFNAHFRSKSNSVELWNPVDATVRCLSYSSATDKQTTVPMQLEAYESAFIVFRNDGTTREIDIDNYPNPQLIGEIQSTWQVKFQENRGAPKNKQTFTELIDWSKHEDEGIRYFSGVATYSNTFNLNQIPTQPLFLHLGKVMVMAKVKINGQEAGGVWTYPYQLDISTFVKKGKNSVEIEVVNNWCNRIIGEKNLPQSDRFTKQSCTRLTADTPLQPSGLMGPVKLITYDYKYK